MQSLIRLFADIVLHRRGPQDVPHSAAVLLAALVAYTLTGALALAPAGTEIVPRMLVDLTLLFAVVGGLLLVTGRKARMMQTFSALLGTGALLTLLSLPFLWMSYAAVDAEGRVPANDPLLIAGGLGLIVLLVVSLLVTGHILRSALEWPYAAGVLVAVVYFGLSVELFRRLFPENGG